MKVTLKPARKADGAAIGSILSGWIDETDWMPRIHTREQDLEHGCMLVDVCNVSLARSGDQVVGFLARQGDEIQALYLARDARGQGVGARLLEQAKGQAEQLALWSFQANCAALRFYLWHGFVEDQRTDGAGNDEGLPDVHLVWKRNSA